MFSYQGITGNEMANLNAKEASTLSLNKSQPPPPFYVEEILHKTRGPYCECQCYFVGDRAVGPHCSYCHLALDPAQDFVAAYCDTVSLYRCTI